MVIGRDLSGNTVTADHVGSPARCRRCCATALHPTLMQTTEGTPAFVHTGPFANIAHGNASIVADKVAARFADWVVTEAGFAADMGGEKFFDIKCRALGHEAGLRAARRDRARAQGALGPIHREDKAPRCRRSSRSEDLDGAGRGLFQPRGPDRQRARFGVPVVVAVEPFPERHGRPKSIW
jgi:formyltetrahydrofolate synthetase